MENNKIEVIKKDSIITIQLSGVFYKGVQNVMFHLSGYRDPEDLTKLIEKMNKQDKNDEYDDWETCMETMLILCAEIEEKAKEQKCTEEIEIPSQNDTSGELELTDSSL